MSNNNDRSGREDNPNDDISNAAGSSTELYYAGASLTKSGEEQIELYDEWARAKAERGEEDSQLEFDQALYGQDQQRQQ
ncbi:hypothetical protein B9479_003555 [Cryptococcus floricola]|uniref:Uncharacterized protein n=1 Tax=Cryptococcus floricola TaxID=2591691 RepID=A0A5D3AWI5_9TREE|nr:hypothetical protein B9479_003555 [Cryptococcus floricola]